MFSPITHVSEQLVISILVVRYYVRISGSASRRLFHAICCGVVPIFSLFDAAIAQERANDNGVGDASSPENLSRRPDRAVLLSPVMVDDRADAQSCHNHESC